ncbi:MAG: oligosaccharide flippase family protein [Gammaproteobacteria bacterium]|jgi:O-antigen/teichoic acid export membrane protein
MKKNFLKKILNDDFAINSLKLFSGDALASIIPILVLPVISRLFHPGAFGEMQLIVSMITVFSIISTLQYEISMVIAKRKESDAILHLALILLFITTLCFVLVILIAGKSILAFFNVGYMAKYIYLVCVGYFAFGLLQLLQFFLVARKKYNQYSIYLIYQAIVTQGLNLITGILSPSYIALFVNQIVGRAVVIFLIFKKNIINWDINKKRIFFVARKYKKFPLIETVSVFLNTFAIQLPIFMLSKYFSMQQVGYYIMAFLLLNKPLTLITSAMSQVFLKVASEAYHEGIEQLFIVYKKTLLKLLWIIIVPVIIVVVGAPYIIPLLLGSKWIVTGHIMQILIVWKFFEFLNVPISNSFSIMNLQEISFFLRVFSITLRFFAMYIFSDTLMHMIIALSVSAAIYYLCYNFLVCVSILVKRRKERVSFSW